ncbi:MAG: STAS domain-containing protein [Solirubrobacteraceae bacterium]
MPEFSAERFEDDDQIRLVLAGELDLAHTGKLEALASEVPPGGALTVEVAELEFIDSSGLRVLMNLDLRSRREGWTFAIANPRAQVLRLLKLCGFDQRLPVIVE